MNVRYTPTKEDITSFYLYQRKHIPSYRKRYLFNWLGPVVIFGCLYLLIWYYVTRDTSFQKMFIYLLPLLLFSVFYLCYFPWSCYRNLRKAVDLMFTNDKNKYFFGTEEIKISTEEINICKEFCNRTLKWQAIKNLVLFEGYIHLYEPSNTVTIIPASAFETREEFELFYNTANEYWKATNSKNT